MARTVKVADLRDRIRVLADQRVAPGSDHPRWTNAIVLDLINEALVDFWDVVLSVNKTYNMDSATFNIVSGTDNYDLDTIASDYYKLHGVDILGTDGEWETIGKFMWAERNDQRDSHTTRSGMRYKEMGSTLYFDAAPGWSETDGGKIWYIPAPAKLVEFPSTPYSFDGVHGWDQYIAYKVAAEIRAAEEEDITSLAALMGMAEARIKERAKKRDMENPPHARDARKRFDRPHRRLPRP